MDVRSNLDLAKKYEWYSMMDNFRGDKKLSDRHASLARQSMINAAICYSKDNNRKEKQTYHVPTSMFTSEDFKSPLSFLPMIFSAAFIIGIYILGGML